MTRTPTDPVPRNRRPLWIGATAAAALLGVLAAVASWIDPPPEATFVAGWASHLRTPLVPDIIAGENDRDALAAAGFFRRHTFHSDRNLSADLFRTELQRDANHHGARVVYVSGYAVRDDHGRVALMTNEFRPYTGVGALPLESLLKQTEAGDHPTLLVLDLTWTAVDGAAALLPSGVASDVYRLLDQHRHLGRLTLVSCSPHETAAEIFGTGRSAFGYFFEAALAGHADGANRSGVTDGRVSACEVGAYVCDRVAAWSRQWPDQQQTPRFFGGGDADFLLTVSGRVDDALPLPQAVEEYPAALSAGWATRDELADAGARRLTPRLLGRLEDNLLDAGRRWRRGAGADTIAAKLAVANQPLLEGIREALAQTSLAPGVSLAEVDMASDDPTLIAWRTLLAAAKQDPPPPKLDPLLAPFRNATADAATDTLAAAGFAALLECPAEFCRLAPVVAGEIAARGPADQPLEVVDLCRLVEIAAANPNADPLTLSGLLEATVLRERAWSRAESVAAVKPLLMQADQHNQSAWAVITSPGFAAENDAAALNRRARALFHQAALRQRQLSAAIAVSDRLAAELPATLPLVRSSKSLENAWNESVGGATRLADLLQQIAATDKRVADAEWDQLATLVTQLTQLERTLLAAVSVESVQQLVADLGGGDAERAPHAERLLDLPLLRAPQREAVSLALSKAVAADADQLRELIAAPNAVSRVPQADLPALAIESVASRIVRRSRALDEAQRTSCLLGLMGMPSDNLSKVIASFNPHADSDDGAVLLDAVRQAMAATEGQIDDDLPLAIRERASRVLPASLFLARLDGRNAGPALRAGLQVRAAWREANAERLRLSGDDLGGTEFATAAAKRWAPLYDQAPPVLAVRPAEAGSLGAAPTLAALCERSPSDRLELQIDHPDHTPLSVQVLQPTGCLRVDVQQRASDGGSRVTLRATIKPDASFADIAATRGVLLRLVCGDRCHHCRVAGPRLADASPFELYAEAAGVRTRVTDRWRLPPSSQPSETRLIVKNRTGDQFAFTAQVDAGARYAATATVAPFSEAPLSLALPVPAPGAAPKPATPQECGAITVSITDATTNKQLFHQKTLLAVRDPREYLEVLDARLATDARGAPIATLRVERLAGAPEPIDIDWQLANPSISSAIVAGGRLSATLTANQPTATLTASLLPDWSAAPEVLAQLAINGVRRASLRRAPRPIGDQTQRLNLVEQPITLLSGPDMVASGDALNFTVDAAPVPAGASLQVDIVQPSPGGDVSGNDGLVERSRSYPTARREQVTIGAAAKSGALLLHPTIIPVDDALDTTGLIGRRLLRARVFDSEGAVIASAVQPVVIDGDAASSIAVKPAEAGVAGKPLAFAVAAVDDLSGIQQVVLYAGAPIDDAPPKGAALVPAVEDPAHPGQWVATVPMPAGVPVTLITAQVTNGVGLTTSRTIQTPLQDATLAGLGQVAGAVTEGVRPQPGLPVELRDPEQKPIASAKTDAQGKFLFTKVKPGKYLVWSVKEQSQRTGAAGVEVQPGATATAELKLSL
ncbi:hypothetical protein Pla123a_31030 [Posidoniimonas polymericola]|uniref:Uncharacterized protein n=1 Tax=Posidoniimonas polymericola TaxID=2528002 RepID=A0A5C5YKZ6_9BACT|nr:carboxypeptidase-like regulatory domain-containing protein [Posidoniimonas polymericola]TWT75593.1 hypothetical protein Pla123a_31030 [Posidoniimonas polymericola]